MRLVDTAGENRQNSDDSLDSWKEIASHLGRTVRTVQRWEQDENLPVHRHQHEKRGTVYASRSEIDAWRLDRGSEITQVANHDRARHQRRWAVAGFAALGIAALAVFGWPRFVGRDAQPAAGGLGFEERDWVLITAFENRSGEEVFDGTLEYALERELVASQRLNVVPRERIGDILRLMRKPPDTVVDGSLGREVALRDGGIRTLIDGRIDKVGEIYALDVDIVDPADGRLVARLSEEATGRMRCSAPCGGCRHRCARPWVSRSGPSGRMSRR